MDIFSGLLAKSEQASLFASFDSRKGHLHQEKRVDKRGHVSSRWVNNGEKPKPKAKAKPDDVSTGGFGDLFDYTPPERPSAVQSLFDFAQAAPRVKPPDKATPRRPKPKDDVAPTGMRSLFDFDDAPPAAAAPTKKGPAKKKPAATGGLFDFDDAPAAPAAAQQTPSSFPPAAPRLKDGVWSVGATQDEYRAQEAGKLHTGDRKTIDGQEYVLNDNHRWTRPDDAPKVTGEAAPIDAPAAPLRLVTSTGLERPLAQQDDGSLKITRPGFENYAPFVPVAGEPGLFERKTDTGTLRYQQSGDELRFLGNAPVPAPEPEPAPVPEPEPAPVPEPEPAPVPEPEPEPAPAPTFEPPTQLTLSGRGPATLTVHDDGTISVPDLPELTLKPTGPGKYSGVVGTKDMLFTQEGTALRRDHEAERAVLDARTAKLNEERYQRVLKAVRAVVVKDPDALSIIQSNTREEALPNLARVAYQAQVTARENDKLSWNDTKYDTEEHTRLAGDLYDALQGSGAERPRLDYSQPFAQMMASVPKYGFDLLERTTRATRRNANRAALGLARLLKKEDRRATPAERDVLAKWSGQGGVDGDINAFYTPTKLSAAMWALMHTHGFTGGRVLEPSVGGGVFAETAPQNVSMTGVEYNGDTATVTGALHPDMALHHSPFETYNTSSEDQLFDAVIGNPPYGARGELGGGSTRDLDKPDFIQAEQYFIDTALDRVKPGGLVTVLVNFGVMQNRSSREFRARMLARADLVTAIRAPVSTFEDSGAMVTPDILVLRKRPAGVGEALSHAVGRTGEAALKAAGVWREDVLGGEYFAKEVRDDTDMLVGYEDGLHPEKALGKVGAVLRARHGGFQTAVHGELGNKELAQVAKMAADDAPVGPATVAELASRLKAGGMSDADVQAAQVIGGQDHYPIPEGSFNSDGSLVFRNHRWHKVAENEMPAVKAAITLGKEIQRLHGMISRGSTVSAETLRQDLVQQLSEYVSQHGDPSSNPDVRSAATRLHFLHHLLQSVDDGKAAGSLAQPVQGFALSDHDPDDVRGTATMLAKNARLTPETLADHTALSVDEAKAHLMDSPHFAFSGSRWLRAEDYYWGDALIQAENARALAVNSPDSDLSAKLNRQADHFESLVDKKAIHDIDFSPRDKFIPLDVLENWMNSTTGIKDDEDDTPNRLRMKFEDGVYSAYTVDPHSSAMRQLKTDRVQDLLDYLNHKTKVDAVRGKKDMTAAEYAEERAENVRQAKEYELGLKRNFRTWVFSNDAQSAIEQEYNRNVGSYITAPDQYEPFELPGWDFGALQPHPFQWSAVRKAVSQGSSYIGLDVGLGKTSTGLMITARLKEQGKARKPLITMPKPVLSQWAEEIERIYPGNTKKVLVIGVTKGADGKWRDDSPEVKQAKLARLAAESDFDAVLMHHDLLEGIPMRRETRQQMLMEDYERQRLEALSERAKFEKNGSKGKPPDVKDVSRFVGKHMEKIGVAQGTDIAFEDLGIDAIIGDEAHNWKNLYQAPTAFGEQIKFLGAGAESQQAMEFQHKAKYVRQQNGDGSGIFAMSATPTKNSPLELFYALQFVTDDLAKRGIPSVDDFLDRYCEKGTVIVPDRSGTLKPFTAITGFKNLDELRGIMDRYLIRETARTALVKDKVSGELREGLTMPDREDREVFFEMQPEVASQMANLRVAAGAVNMREDPGKVLSLMDEMRKLSLDPALVGQQYRDLPNPRFQEAARIAKQAMDEGGKAIMFMDKGLTGSGEGDAYSRLVDHLVEAGVPRDQIAVLTSKTATQARRAQIQKDFQAGKVRVVIGNKTMEEGINLQNGTTDMVHLDTPWDPGSYWQRLGRAHRQGNPVATVRNHVLLAKGSFDQFTYSAMRGKKGWTDSLWDRSVKGSQNGDLETSMDDLQLQLSADPEKAKEALSKQREAIKAAAYVTMIKAVSGDVQTYRSMGKALRTAQNVSIKRKKGPTVNDKAIINRLTASMKQLRDLIESNTDYPYLSALDHRGAVFISPDTGAAYHEGMHFTLNNQTYKTVRVRSSEGSVVADDPNGKRTVFYTKDLNKATGHSLSAPFNPPSPAPSPLAA